MPTEWPVRRARVSSHSLAARGVAATRARRGETAKDVRIVEHQMIENWPE